MKRLPFLALVGLLFVTTVSLPAGARRHDVVIVDSAGTATPSFVRGLTGAAFDAAPVGAALAHLRAHRDRYAIGAPEQALEPLEVTRTAGRVDVRFQQLHDGIPVWGAQYVVHMRQTPAGLSTEAANGHVFSGLATSNTPSFDVSVAQRLVRARLSSFGRLRLHRNGLVVLPIDDGTLAYHFTALGERSGRPMIEEIFVDAQRGTIALAFNNVQHDGPVAASGETSHGRQVSFGGYQRGDVVEMRDRSKPMFSTSGGEITTHNVRGSSTYLATDANIVTSPTTSFSGRATTSGAVDAHYGASVTYDFYKALGRDSLDGAGMDIVSSVNASERDGSPMFNAFWDGVNEQMVYGNPAPREFHPFSAEVDVVGHELTHGVTQHSGNLVYLAQSGAMNEAYSDYFGNAIDVIDEGTSMSDPEAGEIGEGLCKTSQSFVFTCPLRDLNDGSTTEDYIYFLVDLDNGGVHLNSTIYGGALWDVREALGADADRFIYRALTAYTTPLDDFVDGRNAVIAAAGDLGATQEQVDAIEAAFDAHGIVEGWDASSQQDGTVLQSNVAPVSDIGFSIPRLSGDRFVIADYEDKAELCCVGLQVFAGTVDGGDPLQRVSVPDPSSRYTDESPDISGDRVVWTRIRIGRARLRGSSIMMRRLGRPEAAVARGSFLNHPAIDGDLVAWESTRSNVDVLARRLGRRTRVVAGGRGDQVMPSVAGEWVAWWEHRGRPRIGLKNLATGKERTIRPDDRFDFTGPPTLTKRYLFWFEQSSFSVRGSIVRMDLRTGRRRVIVRRSSDHAPVWALALTTPIVSANDRYLVYSSELDYAKEFGAVGRPGAVPNDEVGRDIFIVPVGGGTPIEVTSNRADQAFPLIGTGRRVVWLDSSSGLTDLVTREVP